MLRVEHWSYGRCVRATVCVVDYHVGLQAIWPFCLRKGRGVSKRDGWRETEETLTHCHIDTAPCVISLLDVCCYLDKYTSKLILSVYVLFVWLRSLKKKILPAVYNVSNTHRKCSLMIDISDVFKF